ncbi:MAG: sodium:proton antiporter [Thermoanaerobaculaceae bacterium]
MRTTQAMRPGARTLRGVTVAAFAYAAAAPARAAEAGDPRLGVALPAWSALPFLGLLLSIALLPLLAERFWQRHYPKVAAGWAFVFAIPFLAAYGSPALHAIGQTAFADYLPFVLLLGSLYLIGGGVHIRGTLRGSPPLNAMILLVGTGLASWIGTTGATVLLIRPLLRANRRRRYRAHTVVFFIFLVANIGGALTPLGDPPLFLGFLHGVPFFWTLRLWRETAFVVACLVAAYLAVDTWHWRREEADVREDPEGPREAIRIEGWHNLAFLGGVLAAVILSGSWNPGSVSILGVQRGIAGLVRDGVLLLMAAGSWLTTSPRLRERNDHAWEPIREVAILFAGVFVTMIPVLAMLNIGELGALGFIIRAVHTPAALFWATGGLSSLLDNAPTFLTSLSTALGRLQSGLPEHEGVLRLIGEKPEVLRAIATGAVFMGANTYIGNAPNFLAKSIAENAGVRMPSFFGYIVRYTLPFLVPVFALATWVFFV